MSFNSRQCRFASKSLTLLRFVLRISVAHVHLLYSIHQQYRLADTPCPCAPQSFFRRPCANNRHRAQHWQQIQHAVARRSRRCCCWRRVWARHAWKRRQCAALRRGATKHARRRARRHSGLVCSHHCERNKLALFVCRRHHFAARRNRQRAATRVAKRPVARLERRRHGRSLCTSVPYCEAPVERLYMRFGQSVLCEHGETLFGEVGGEIKVADI